MSNDIITVDEFEKTRVARFDQLEGSRLPMLDAVIPGCEREIYQIIGRGVGEDATQKAAITDNRDFNVGVVRCAPGKGTLHHDHETNEVFMPLKGRWKIFWGDDEESRYVLLDPWDVASCPPHVMRGFPNRVTRKACSSSSSAPPTPAACNGATTCWPKPSAAATS